MSGNGAVLVVAAALLLAGCADQGQRAAASPPVTAPGACGVETSIPDGTTVRPEDVPVTGGTTTAHYRLLTDAACSGTVAKRPDRCDAFPWATEQNLFALGGRAWLAVGVGQGVREQIVFHPAGSSFADTYVRAAQECGFSTLTVLDGAPVTLQRSRAGTTEIVYMTPRAVIWMSGPDQVTGVPDLVRLAGLAEERSEGL